MSWPQFLLIALVCLNLGIVTALDGKPTTHKAGPEVVGAAVFFLLLWWGGFFSGGAC